MLPFDHPLWPTLIGGYRDPYDASVALKRLLDDEEAITNPEELEEVWEELWEQLHHQGDVDSASYATVPYLLEYARRSPKLDWNVFGLIGIIELERPTNPAPPAAIAEGYFAAIKALPQMLCSHPDQAWDEPLTRFAVACIALARGQRVLGRAYLEMDEEAAKGWLREYNGWEEQEQRMGPE